MHRTNESVICNYIKISQTPMNLIRLLFGHGVCALSTRSHGHIDGLWGIIRLKPCSTMILLWLWNYPLTGLLWSIRSTDSWHCNPSNSFVSFMPLSLTMFVCKVFVFTLTLRSYSWRVSRVSLRRSVLSSISSLKGWLEGEKDTEGRN